MKTTITTRPLSVIAGEIARDWKSVYFGARPYLAAMMSLDTMRDMYGVESASSIVNYFLANAKTWRGPVAKATKLELNRMLKSSAV